MRINFSTYRADDIDAKLRQAQFRPLDVMVAGVTGAGKSTTLNALFQKTVATVGEGVDPETMEIAPYRLNDVFRVWDTPGLGDGVQTDEIHKRKMVDLLQKTYTYDNGFYGFIDLVLVIIDGSNRDMGTTYTLLNEVIVPNIQRERILVVINQADVAMKGRHWNQVLNSPDSTLVSYLEDRALSIQGRVREATGINILKPVYYSAKHEYHMREVFDFIIDHMPSKRRSYFGEAAVGIVNEIFNTVAEDCYITTATCEELGKADDCYELTSFRNFRDNWLKAQPDGQILIDRYYATAPAIVELINRQSNRSEIYRDLNERYLSKCLAYIENGENEACKETYIDMMNYLFGEQEKWG